MVSPLDCLTSAWKMKQIPTDNLIFRLHYKGTFRLLIFFSILVLLFHFFTKTVTCMNTGETMVNYCLFKGLFIRNSETKEKEFFTYFAWTFFAFFFQAFPFYFPHFLWKCKERGKQESVLLQQAYAKSPATRHGAQTGLLIKLMGNRVGGYIYEIIHEWGWYAYWYFACEGLNLAVVLLEIFFINLFLKGKFLDYGPKVINYVFSNTSSENPIFELFPITIYCDYELIGSQGDAQRHSTICSLPINPYLAWIYVLLWFWFVILAGLSGLVLIYRVFLLWPHLRFWILLWHSPKVDPSKLESILNAGNIGDWLLLNRLCKNMDQTQFRNLIDFLYNQIQDSYSKIDGHQTQETTSPNSVNYVFVNSHVNQMLSTVALSRTLSSSDSDIHRRVKTMAEDD